MASRCAGLLFELYFVGVLIASDVEDRDFARFSLGLGLRLGLLPLLGLLGELLLFLEVRPDDTVVSSAPTLYAPIALSFRLFGVGLIQARLVFMEADDDTIVRRFSETRRPHPLGTDKTIHRSILAERRQLAPIRAMADLSINTSKFTVHELREFIGEKFTGEREASKIMVYVTSFGYRHGVPADSDLVFDVRFLPNPNYIPRFKHLSGRHPSVARYIRSFPQTVEFVNRISELLIYLLPHYIREGKSYLTIAFGCTGGHHRSVMIADQIRKNLVRAGFKAKVTHRDLGKPV